MKVAGKIAQSLLAAVMGAIGLLGVALAYVVTLVIAPFLVLLLVGGVFMMSPETRGEMLWHALPWLLGFAGSVWLVTGAVLWLVWIWTRDKRSGSSPTPA
jgi:hypothetical protein